MGGEIMALNSKKKKGIFIRLGTLAFWMGLLLLTRSEVVCASTSLRIGDSLPAFTFSDTKGFPVKVPDNFGGKVIVLHFWMMGCSSCREEMPAMDSLFRTYQGKGLEILAVNVGQPKEKVKTYAAGLKVSYPILVDPDMKGTEIYTVSDVPRTYLVDRHGVVRYRILGGAAPEVLKKLILSLL